MQNITLNHWFIFRVLRRLKGLIVIPAIVISPYILMAQSADETGSGRGVYQAAAEKVNDLVHTKLEARFDYDNSYLIGKVWLTLKPHFYSTDSLILDAKGMEVKGVGIVNKTVTKPLKYAYDGRQIRIRLDKTYRSTDQYKVYIDYVAKPNDLGGGGSSAIRDDKGLYFINPKGEEKDKPTQVWTQGETESTSVWLPTIDKPNQKSTQEFFLVVPSKYVTLSNGLLLQQQKNADGTRTDYWKMDLPHAPYLFFIGIGDYAIVKDTYKGKEVSYYVEKEYAGVARKIFGNTPEMIQFFEKLTGVSYPWQKYAQMTARDYVSGAMENTTATLHQEGAQQDSRQLLDGNIWEGTIAHELFHHWFGDYVTAKSWSNLTVNESFANLSQLLWAEYKYGKDAGDAENYKNLQEYLGRPEEARKPLVRYYYKDREDMFDLVSYQKGGRILNMLRNYLGEEAFYKGLNLYLTSNKYGTAEAHQLRLALEEVSGRDLNWFFNQWYFGAGHPKLTVEYSYSDDGRTASVHVKQTQEGTTFILPVAIDLYFGKEKKRQQVWVDKKDQVFTFSTDTKPDLVNFDGDKILLCEKKESGKTLANFIHQYTVAGTYLDRREAIEGCAGLQDSTSAVELLKTALRDRYQELRILALQSVNLKNDSIKQAMETTIFYLSKSDPDPKVKAEALMALSLYDKPIYKELIQSSVNDSSYSVAGAALRSLNELDKQLGYEEARKLSSLKAKDKLAEAICHIFAENGREEDLDYVVHWYNRLPLGRLKVENANMIAYYAVQLESTGAVKKAVDALVQLRNEIPAAYKKDLHPFINTVLLKAIVNQKISRKNMSSDAQAIQEQIDYINSKIE